MGVYFLHWLLEIFPFFLFFLIKSRFFMFIWNVPFKPLFYASMGIRNAYSLFILYSSSSVKGGRLSCNVPILFFSESIRILKIELFDKWGTSIICSSSNGNGIYFNLSFI